MVDQDNNKGANFPLVKLAKNDTAVNYVVPSPDLSAGKMCGTCQFWAGEGACHIVSGAIQEVGYCGLHRDQSEMQAALNDVLTDVEQSEENGGATLSGMQAGEMLEGGYRSAEHTPPPLIQNEPKTRRGFWGGLFGAKDSDLESGFKVIGNHWFAIYSNNFEDNESEVFAKSAIVNYVKRVDSGIVDKPFLTIWHLLKPDGKDLTRLNGVAIGQAKMVGHIGNFAVAAGEFFTDEMSQAAKAYYKKNADKTRLSHGFLFRQKDFENGVYNQYNTYEITLLPASRAANPFTSFAVKENKSMLTPEKIQYLTEVYGGDKAKVDKLVAQILAVGQTIADAGVGFKDMTPIDDLQNEVERETTAQRDKAVGTIDGVSFTEFYPQILEDLGALADTDLAAAKALKAYNAGLVSLQARVKQLETLLELAPQGTSVTDGGASGSSLSPDELAAAQKDIDAKNKNKDGATPENDPFFGGLGVPKG